MTERPRGLADVRTFIVPISLLNETIRFLRHVGDSEQEGFVLWGGRRDGAEAFRFLSACIPEQHASNSDEGLLVYVDGEALFRVNKTFFERGEILAAQVHTHPGAAYHSDLDDRYPMVTLIGSISLVIPNFGRTAPRDVDDWAWYRLVEFGVWAPLDDATEIVIE